MEKERPGYFAIIPAEVRYDNELPPGARILYGELTALARAEGFAWASNRYFAELYQCDENTISRWVSALAERGHVRVEVSQTEGGYQRKIWIKAAPLLKNEEAPSAKMRRAPPQKCGDKRTVEKESRKEESPASPERAEAERLALLLLQEHRKVDPGFLAAEDASGAAVKRWAPAIERLIRLDGRSALEVEAVIYWCQADEFWRANIMSGEKLRSKFPTLLLQMKRPQGGRNRAPAPPARRAPAAPSREAQEAQAEVDAALAEGRVI